VTEQGEPGFDDEAVARQAAVGAQQGRRGDVTVPGTQAAVGELQFDARGLADQALEFEVRVGGWSLIRSGLRGLALAASLPRSLWLPDAAG
jgi:hypothetical protein